MRMAIRTAPGRFAGGVALLCLILSSGCQVMPGRAPGPARELSRREVIARLYERTHFFSSLTDADVSLRVVYEGDAGRERFPSVGGVLAFDRMVPGLWLRTEKLWQNVFTLRAHRDSFWLELPDSREIITGGGDAYERMPHLVRPAEVLLWFATPDWLGLTWETATMSVTRDAYVFDVHLNGFLLRRVRVGRYDGSISSIIAYDILGDVDTRVDMDRYRRVNGSFFPHRFIISRPKAGYEITLRLGRPEFNREIPERTFLPRHRPGWKHIDLDREPVPVIRGDGR